MTPGVPDAGSLFKTQITPWKFTKIKNGSREHLMGPGGVVWWKKPKFENMQYGNMALYTVGTLYIHVCEGLYNIRSFFSSNPTSKARHLLDLFKYLLSAGFPHSANFYSVVHYIGKLWWKMLISWDFLARMIAKIKFWTHTLWKFSCP